MAKASHLMWGRDFKVEESARSKKKKKKKEQTKEIEGEIENQNGSSNGVRPDIHQLLLESIPDYQVVCRQHHIEVLKKPPAKRPNALFLCTLCQYYCDTWNVLLSHISKSKHMTVWEEWCDETGATLLPKPTEEQVQSLTQLIKDVSAEYGISEINSRGRHDILKRLNEIVAKQFAGCSLELYGSSQTGMGLCLSDINMNFAVPPTLDGPNSITKLYKIILDDSDYYQNVEFDTYADIPTIEFIDCGQCLRCKITLNNTNAAKVTLILWKYSKVDPRVRPLIIAFRMWANLCGIDQVDNGMLPSYAYALLVIYFLQQLREPVVPVLHEMVSKPEDITVKGPHNFEKWKSKNMSSLGSLWLGIFKFYFMDFDAGDRVVSIQSSRIVKRSVKKWSGKRIAIEDPWQIQRNVSKTLVNGKCFTYFMTCLRLSYTYFAIPQTKYGSIFRRVQTMPNACLKEHMDQREVFLKYVMDTVPYFKSDGTLAAKKPQGSNIEDAPPTVSANMCKIVVTPEQAAMLYAKFNPKYFAYEFSKEKFNGGEKIPVVCILCREEGHKKETCPEETMPPLEKLSELSDQYLEKLSEVCEAVHDAWSLSKNEFDTRHSIVDNLRKYISRFFPDVSLKLFGSSCNGFGLRGSDIDVCLTLKDNPNGQGLNFADLIVNLCGILKKYPEIGNLVPITTAKVPILKFSHYETNLDGDVSFYNTLAQENTKLLKTYAVIDKRCKVLGFAVKRFAKVCDICDASRGSLSSYAYVLMVIYFLQNCNPPVLPVLQEIYVPGRSRKYIVENCNTYFFSDVQKLPGVWPEFGQNTSSVGALWIEFLCFYTEVFNFKRDVISIRTKKQVLRFEKLWNSKCMAIEDPFDISHNLGAGLSRKMYNYIIKAFRKGRAHFGNPKNMPLNEPVDFLLDKYFHHPSFKGAPPDRGCRMCKKIGHIQRDCPLQKDLRSKGQECVEVYVPYGKEHLLQKAHEYNRAHVSNRIPAARYNKPGVSKDYYRADRRGQDTYGVRHVGSNDRMKTRNTWWNSSMQGWCQPSPPTHERANNSIYDGPIAHNEHSSDPFRERDKLNRNLPLAFRPHFQGPRTMYDLDALRPRGFGQHPSPPVAQVFDVITRPTYPDNGPHFSGGHS